MKNTASGSDGQLSALEIARELARYGVPVFTAPPNESKIGFRLPDGWEQTRPDPAAVDAWRPGMALCAVMGHGLDLVDADPRNGADLDGVPLPRSLGLAATPSDGVHSFVAGLHERSRDKVRPGVDYKGGDESGRGRGFAFIAPTVRASKVDGVMRAYRWVTRPDLAALARGGDDSGRAFADLVRQARAGGTGSRDQAALSPDGLPEPGGQHLWLRDKVWDLVQSGQDGDTVAAWFDGITPRLELSRPGEPWTRADLPPLLDGARARYEADHARDGWPAGFGPEPARIANGYGSPDGQAAQAATLRLMAASGITPERVRWLWKDKLKLGGLALLAGDVGLGKSTIAVDITARLTRGTLPGEYSGAPQDVILCATEDEWADTIVPRLMAANADLTKVWQLTAAQKHGANLMLPVQVGELAGLITGSGARLVILDPLMSRLDPRLDSHKDAEVRRALEPLVEMAAGTGVTVLGLIHENKSGENSALKRVMGSAAFAAVARSVLYAAPLLSRDPDGQTFVLATPKNNLAARGSADVYRIQPVVLPVPGIVTATRIHWLDKLEQFYLDAELAEARKRKTATAADRAAEWLAEYLTGRGGRADSAEVRKDGQRAGHAVRTLKRAKDEAGVSTENTSTLPRRTIWVLDDYEPPASGARDEASGSMEDMPAGASGATRAGGPPEFGPTGEQESVCGPTDTDCAGQGQSGQSGQVSGSPREAGPTASVSVAPGYPVPDAGPNEAQLALIATLQARQEAREHGGGTDG